MLYHEKIPPFYSYFKKRLKADIGLHNTKNKTKVMIELLQAPLNYPMFGSNNMNKQNAASLIERLTAFWGYFDSF